MTAERKRLALAAARRAYELRRSTHLPLDGPCCVYDLAEELGVEVRFADLPSMEGVYYPGKPAIVVFSLRPSGRQAFTCAHELGHHLYGHGEQFDELIEERADTRRRDPKEFQADCFAGAVLMPKLAVLTGLSRRGIDASKLSPEAAYRLAVWLGVGYTTILNHLSIVLGLVSKPSADALKKVRLPAIRKLLVGRDCSAPLIVADDAWSGRAIDMQVSDVILLPADVEFEGSVLAELQRDRSRCIATAVRPGIGRVARANGSWAQYVRVCRKQFTGMARFRHLEEADDG